ncbi:hypothetical protein [Kitasatospora viridis]|uniref:Fibronectin type-III domain-containing protein n=1 Tax=Kitasatospora viridis TaxID=281105 RepID=A0A561UBV9_9ACTN|nr:hypothetical protein [Kitasatospora viridis]TWF96841.1 hypothetical protein FHX73_11614 [Kitasatospora viridis]
MRTALGTRARLAFATATAIGFAMAAPVAAHAAGGAPVTPTELFNAYLACSTDPGAPVYVASRSFGLQVEGIAGDTDPSATDLTEQFQYWPTSDPTQVTTSSRTSYVTGNELSTSIGPLTDGQTFAWQARTVDPSGATSAWSAPCYVADDDTAPATAPTVSSPNYPAGQPVQGGAPIQFDFGAGGVGDVAGYEYSWTGDFPVPSANIGANGVPSYQDIYADPKIAVRAATLGGSGTVSLVPPSDTGLMRLSVISLDRAGNRSPVTTYDIRTTPDAPTITKHTPTTPFGEQATFKLTADPGLQSASPVVSYTVVHQSANGQTKTTVPAGSDGTAELHVVLDGPTGDTLTVSSTSADGWVSEQASWNNGYLDTTPTVTSTVYPENGSGGGTGVPGTFTFAPKIPGGDIASYTYQFNSDPTVTVPAGADGTAQITWTPPTSDWYQLTVYATTTKGVQLSPYYYSFSVN